MIDFVTVPQTTKRFFGLNRGDVVQTTIGVFAFDRIPKGGRSWYGKSMDSGKNFRIRIVKFDQEYTVIGRYNFAPEIPKFVRPSQNDVNTLSSGDLFVIKHGRGENAELYRYVRRTDKKIIAVNPVTNKTFNIALDFTFTKITNLPY